MNAQPQESAVHRIAKGFNEKYYPVRDWVAERARDVVKLPEYTVKGGWGLSKFIGGALVLLTGGIFLGAWKLTEKGITYAASFDKDFEFGLNKALALYDVKGKS